MNCEDLFQYLIELKNNLHKEAQRSSSSYSWAQFHILEQIVEDLKLKNTKQKDGT